MRAEARGRLRTESEGGAEAGGETVERESVAAKEGGAAQRERRAGGSQSSEECEALLGSWGLEPGDLVLRSRREGLGAGRYG